VSGGRGRSKEGRGRGVGQSTEYEFSTDGGHFLVRRGGPRVSRIDYDLLDYTLRMSRVPKGNNEITR
jgi:hypothetical protein